MDTQTPLPTPEPVDSGRSRRRSVFGGAVLGAIALTASVVGISAIAGAQDDTEPEIDTAAAESEGIDILGVDEAELADEDGFLDDDFDMGEIEIDPAFEAFDQCITDALGSIDEPAEDVELSDEEWEALEAQFEAAEAQCDDLLPEDVKAEIAAYEPYEECIDTQLDGIAEPEVDDESEIDEEAWKALDDAWMAADEACFDLLPEDAKAEAEAFKAYDQCLTDAGFGDEDFGTVVYVEGDEGGQSIQFGDEPGSVTITGDSSGVSVATEGGVTVLDEAALESAFEACDDVLPEDMFDIEESDEFDLDDEGTDEDGDTEEDGDTDEGDEGDDDA